VCVCDGGEQLSAGRCTQRGAIRHGGVTHIKDTHTHTHTHKHESVLAAARRDHHTDGSLSPGSHAEGFGPISLEIYSAKSNELLQGSEFHLFYCVFNFIQFICRVHFHKL